MAPVDRAPVTDLAIASMLDIAGTKVSVVQKRAQAKDYIDIDALLQTGLDLSTALSAGRVVYGRAFNPVITLKALSYFGRSRASTRAPAVCCPARRCPVKALPATPAMLTVARRVVWLQEPAETPADPVYFLAHVMTYGTCEDLAALDGVVGLDEFREALDKTPPGIFDARSWAYWNLRVGRQSAPPLRDRLTVAPVG